MRSELGPGPFTQNMAANCCLPRRKKSGMLRMSLLEHLEELRSRISRRYMDSELIFVLCLYRERKTIRHRDGAGMGCDAQDRNSRRGFHRVGAHGAVSDHLCVDAAGRVAVSGFAVDSVAGVGVPLAGSLQAREEMGDSVRLGYRWAISSGRLPSATSSRFATAWRSC